MLLWNFGTIDPDYVFMPLLASRILSLTECCGLSARTLEVLWFLLGLNPIDLLSHGDCHHLTSPPAAFTSVPSEPKYICSSSEQLGEKSIFPRNGTLSLLLQAAPLIMQNI